MEIDMEMDMDMVIDMDMARCVRAGEEKSGFLSLFRLRRGAGRKSSAEISVSR